MKKLLIRMTKRSWRLISDTTNTWAVIAAENKPTSILRKNYVFLWIMVCTLITFMCHFAYASEHRFQIATIEAIIEAIALFGGYFLAEKICLWILRKQIPDVNTQSCETIVAYSFTTIYILHVVTTILPSLFFLYILSAHSAYLVWEGMQSVLIVDEEDRGNLVIAFAAVIVFTPILISKIIHFMLPNV